MKLINLLNVISGTTVIWITKEDDADGVFCGEAVDAEANIPREYLFGDVLSVYAEYYKGYARSGISIIVKPYTSV